MDGAGSRGQNAPAVATAPALPKAIDAHPVLIDALLRGARQGDDR